MRLASLLAGGGAERSLLLPGTPATPPPSLLEGRSLPVMLVPGVVESEWRLTLPWAGCRLEPAAAAVESEVGAFEQEAALESGVLVVRRRTELRRREVPPARFAALRDLALAEHRTLKRRLRLSCPAS